MAGNCISVIAATTQGRGGRQKEAAGVKCSRMVLPKTGHKVCHECKTHLPHGQTWTRCPCCNHELKKWQRSR